MLPSEYRPVTAADFIGPTRAIATRLFAIAGRLAGGGEGNFRLLLHGPPGNGKTALALGLARHLIAAGATARGCDPAVAFRFEHELVNGQSCTVELVREWSRQGAFRPMYGLRRVRIIDEVDAMSPAALNEFRTFADALRPGFDLIMTTNRTLEQLQPQLQSRAMAVPVPAVPADDIARWLAERWRVALETAREIAAGCAGNVRAATFDADTYIA